MLQGQHVFSGNHQTKLIATKLRAPLHLILAPSDWASVPPEWTFCGVVCFTVASKTRNSSWGSKFIGWSCASHYFSDELNSRVILMMQWKGLFHLEQLGGRLGQTIKLFGLQTPSYLTSPREPVCFWVYMNITEAAIGPEISKPKNNCIFTKIFNDF